ncbi:MAG: hypothetical protein Q8K86_11540 [Candidatus Nanopelagicaceae bacterium]|nr:hypothetical protein [Candidatus Nanopelagicaceae bacterium]
MPKAYLTEAGPVPSSADVVRHFLKELHELASLMRHEEDAKKVIESLVQFYTPTNPKHSGTTNTVAVRAIKMVQYVQRIFNAANMLLYSLYKVEGTAANSYELDPGMDADEVYGEFTEFTKDKATLFSKVRDLSDALHTAVGEFPDVGKETLLALRSKADIVLYDYSKIHVLANRLLRMTGMNTNAEMRRKLKSPTAQGRFQELRKARGTIKDVPEPEPEVVPEPTPEEIAEQERKRKKTAVMEILRKLGMSAVGGMAYIGALTDAALKDLPPEADEDDVVDKAYALHRAKAIDPVLYDPKARWAARRATDE